ncbi:MAG: thioesterase family protein [Thermoanaerobaculia bacterium]
MSAIPAGAFRVSEYVRWSDVDAASLLCYGSYVRFFEIAEMELFRAVGLSYGKIFDRLDIWLPRASMHWDFRSPVLLDERLEVALWVARFGRTSMTLDFAVEKEVEAGRRRTADGRVVMVAIARTSLRPVPIPDELIEKLRPYHFAVA